MLIPQQNILIYIDMASMTWVSHVGDICQIFSHYILGGLIHFLPSAIEGMG